MAKNRGVTGRFLPGNTANPAGRPKGLAAMVQAETRDGAEVVAYMLRVLRDERQPTALRMAAGQWLADRGFGKAVQTVELDASVNATVNTVDPVREKIREVLTRDRADDVARRLLG